MEDGAVLTTLSNPSSLARALEALLSEPGMRKRQAERGTRLYDELLAPTIIATNLLYSIDTLGSTPR
jgi:hypothetical protein